MKHWALPLAAILLLSFAGCEKKYRYATLDTNLSATPASEELLERVREYWEYRSLFDYGHARSFELPYLNFIKDENWYLQFHAHDRKKYRIVLKQVRMHGDEAKVRIHIYLPHTDYGFNDSWYLVNGTWYHYYHPSILPPAVGK